MRLDALSDSLWDPGVTAGPREFEPRVEQVRLGTRRASSPQYLPPSACAGPARKIGERLRMSCTESCILLLSNRYFASQDKVRRVTGLLRALRAVHRESDSATKAVSLL